MESKDKIKAQIAAEEKIRNNLNEELDFENQKLKNLKEKNISLVKLQAGKKRKNPSIAEQRKKILSQTLRCEELENALKAVNQNLESLRDQSAKNEMREDIDRFKERNDYGLSLYGQASQRLGEFVNIVTEIEQELHSKGHPLRMLINYLNRDGKDTLVANGLDTADVAKKWQQAILTINLINENQIVDINIKKQNLLNEANAIIQGHGRFSKAERPPTLRQNIPNFDPHTQALEFEKNRLRKKTDYQKYLAGRKEIKTVVHR